MKQLCQRLWTTSRIKQVKSYCSKLDVNQLIQRCKRMNPFFHLTSKRIMKMHHIIWVGRKKLIKLVLCSMGLLHQRCNQILKPQLSIRMTALLMRNRIKILMRWLSMVYHRLVDFELMLESNLVHNIAVVNSSLRRVNPTKSTSKFVSNMAKIYNRLILSKSTSTAWLAKDFILTITENFTSSARFRTKMETKS